MQWCMAEALAGTKYLPLESHASKSWQSISDYCSLVAEFQSGGYVMRYDQPDPYVPDLLVDVLRDGLVDCPTSQRLGLAADSSQTSGYELHATRRMLVT
jgi:hypothetical protein